MDNNWINLDTEKPPLDTPQLWAVKRKGGWQKSVGVLQKFQHDGETHFRVILDDGMSYSTLISMSSAKPHWLPIPKNNPK